MTDKANASPVLHGGVSEQKPMQITIKLRLRDKHSAEMKRQARAVNVVWNYANETQRKEPRHERV